MWPWGHAAVAYLAYAGYSRYRARDDPAAAGRPGEVGALVAVFASQVPDLIDKPLTWTVGILEYGRSLGHSLLVVLPVLALLWWWLGDDHPVAVTALGVGWLSHPFTDAVGPLLEGDVDAVTYLLWPLLETPEPEVAQSFLAHLLGLSLDASLLAEFALVGVALVVWHHDAYPGLATIRTRLWAPVAALAR